MFAGLSNFQLDFTVLRGAQIWVPSCLLMKFGVVEHNVCGFWALELALFHLSGA
jgi:hypothetical protein